MSKFQVGDTVRVVSTSDSMIPEFSTGTIAKVVEVEVGTMYPIRLATEGTDRTEVFHENELEAVMPELSEPTPDPVNHPSHYSEGMPSGVSVIDVILAQSADYLHGNVIKYVLRWKYKNGVEDLKKAQVYLGWLIEQGEAKTSTMDTPAPDQVHVPYLDN